MDGNAAEIVLAPSRFTAAQRRLWLRGWADFCLNERPGNDIDALSRTDGGVYELGRLDAANVCAAELPLAMPADGTRREFAALMRLARLAAAETGDPLPRGRP